jgi:eukaryotic-like serine/threonine-protein kinase
MAPRIGLALLLGAILITPAPAAVGQGAWGQFHYNAAHTGFNTQERTLTRSTVRRLSQAWSVRTGAAIEGSVAVSGGLIFVGSDNSAMRAYHLDGSLAWSRPLGDSPGFVATPALAGDAVVTYTSAADVRSLAAASGDTRWSQVVSSVVGMFPGSPTYAAGTVYAVPYELVALDAASGSVRWRRDGIGCFVCSPAVADGRLFIGGGPAAGRKLLALNPATGATRWSFRPSGGSSFSWSASPAVSGGRVFQSAFVERAGTKTYWLYAFSASRGKLLWKAKLDTSKFLTSSSPAVAAGTVFYVAPGGRIYAFRASNGKQVWSKKIAPSASSPAVAGGVVYFGAGVTLYGLDTRSGKTLWSAKTSSDPSDPAVVDGSLYVGSGDGTLYAFKLRSAG